MIDFDYAHDVLDSVLLVSDSQGWDRNIRLGECKSLLAADYDYNPNVLEAVVRRFATLPLSPDAMEVSSDIVSLSNEKLFRFWAEKALRDSPVLTFSFLFCLFLTRFFFKEYDIEAFKAVLGEKCDREVVDLGLLQGLALIETGDGNTQFVVRLFGWFAATEPTTSTPNIKKKPHLTMSSLFFVFPCPHRYGHSS